jgi:glycerol kinase
MHVLAIDQGTTGSTCLVVARDGRVVGRGYREITQHYPRPGWVEHDATELLTRTLEAAREAMAAAGVTPSAIGITNQRETVVLWDRNTGQPVHRAIVWQDRRTAPRCAELAGEAARITARTGLVVDPYFSATKLEWLLAQPTIAERAGRGELLAGTVDSWLIWNLTDRREHATDFTNASRTMSCAGCSGCRARCSPTCARRAGTSAWPMPATWGRRCPSRAWPATSRRRCSGRGAGGPGRGRTPTGRAPSSCSTPARRGPRRAAGC